jgi:hypothetical protein
MKLSMSKFSRMKHDVPFRETNPPAPSIPAPRAAGFDFSRRMRTLCEDFVTRLPDELGHIQLDHVAIGFAQARGAHAHGAQASLTPMRFEGGSTETTRNGKRWTVTRMMDPRGREYLYLLRFYMPRFQNLPLEEKLITVVHELWHVSPEFNGDLRRFPGRCYAHNGSRKHYDVEMKGLVDRWLRAAPPESIYDFLRLDFASLRGQHGNVYGLRLPTPRLIQVE